MHFDCRAVDASFFDTAPMRFRHEVDLDATPARVFAIFDDESGWPKWFQAIHKIEWTSSAAARHRLDPHGHTGDGDIVRTLFLLGAGSPVLVYLTGTSMPLAHALAEDYLLDEVAPGKTRFTYRVAMEPRMPVAAGGPLSHLYFDSMFKSACEHLQAYVREN